MPGFFRKFALAALALLLACAPASAWDAGTHREITSLAIQALPPSPLKNLFVKNLSRLEYFSVQPDVIRAKYGDESEKIRHYIDLEYYGADPFDALVADRNAMNRRFGASTLFRSGTLPWTIVDFSNAFEQEWSRGDCNELLRLAGFLAHYVGDASQPLHTTAHYDGYEGDRGVHARIERAADDDVRELSFSAQPRTHLVAIDSVWQTAIAEIRDSNSHIAELLQADRAARRQSSGGRSGYDDALMSHARPMLVEQIARAASVLASIWLYGWKQVGSPAGCDTAYASPPALAQSAVPVQAQHAPNPVPEKKPPDLFRGTSAKDWAAFRERCQELADKNAFHAPLSANEAGVWYECVNYSRLDFTPSRMYLPFLLHGKPQASSAP